MPRLLLILAGMLVLLLSPLWAQELPEMQDVAVFNLHSDMVPVRIEIPRELQNQLDIEVIVDNPRTGTHRGAKAGSSVSIQQQDVRIPTPAEVRTYFEQSFSDVNEMIRQVFVNRRRYNVVEERFSIDAETVDEFVRVLAGYRTDSVEVEEGVQVGHQVFTEEDLHRLAGGKYVVYPAVNYYRVELTRDAAYRVEIQVAFAFNDVEKTRLFERFNIVATGSGDTLVKAISSAVSNIGNLLESRIRTVPEFQIESGIADLVGRRILIGLGRTMGVQVGDTFLILSDLQSDASQSTDETGLIYVTDVRADFSFGIPIYAKQQPQVGDQLQVVPQRVMETEVFGGVQVLEITEDSDNTAMIPVTGLKFTAARGFFPIRPVVQLEYPFTFVNNEFSTSEGSFLGATIGVGAEYLYIHRRLRIAPYFLLGGTAGRYLDGSAMVVLSHLGVGGGLRLGVQASRNIVMYIEPGIAAYISMTDMPSLFGPRLTFGINIK